MSASGYALLPSLLFLFGCPVGRPSPTVVTRIEQKLSRDDCLRDVSSMTREYQIAHRGWKIDPNRIDVKVQEAGLDGQPAGSFVLEPPKSGMADDRPYFVALATYTISNDTLDIRACGQNTSPGNMRR